MFKDRISDNAKGVWLPAADLKSLLDNSLTDGLVVLVDPSYDRVKFHVDMGFGRCNTFDDLAAINQAIQNTKEGMLLIVSLALSPDISTYIIKLISASSTCRYIIGDANLKFIGSESKIQCISEVDVEKALEYRVHALTLAQNQMKQDSIKAATEALIAEGSVKDEAANEFHDTTDSETDSEEL